MAYTYLNPNAIGEKSITADKISDKTITKDKLADDVLSLIGTPDLSGYLPLGAGDQHKLTGVLYTKDIRPNNPGGENINIGSTDNPYKYLFCSNIGNNNSQPDICAKKVILFNGGIEINKDASNINAGSSSYPFNNIHAKKFITNGSTSEHILLGDGNTKKISDIDISLGAHGYIACNVNPGTTQWAKVWSCTAADISKNNNSTITFEYHYVGNSMIIGFIGMSVKRTKDAAPWGFSCNLVNIMGNMPVDSLKMCYNDTTGDISLWYKNPSQWSGMNFKVISATLQTGNQKTIGSWNKTSINSTENLQSNPGAEGDTIVSLTQLAQPALISGDLNVTGNITATGEITAYSSK